MKKYILLFAAISPFAIMAQTPSQQNENDYRTETPNRYVDHGLVRVQGNIALGYPVNTSGTNIYWVGDFDYYIKGNISISSGLFYFINSFNGDKMFKQNHSAYLGASYHFKTNNHLDPYIGILPGYSINQLNHNSIAFNDTTKPKSSYPWSFNPLFSISAGVTFYANRFFNVFARAQYQVGKHYSDIAPVSLNEVKITFGLGYMFWARKKYFKFRKPMDTSQ